MSPGCAGDAGMVNAVFTLSIWTGRPEQIV